MSSTPNPQKILSATLPVMEAFFTIQGEGGFSGSAAYFIRLGGCDVGCVWCDVKESWDADAHPKKSVSELVAGAKDSGAEIAVITGGEPAMHDLTELTDHLRKSGLRTHIETSGAHSLTGEWHWICFSPKKFKAPLDEVYDVADELKVVVYNKHDLKWAETHAAKVRKDCLLYLQPEWDRTETVMPMIVEYVKTHPKWRISLQTHKYMNIL